MLRAALRSAGRRVLPGRRKPAVPYDMFDLGHAAYEARAARHLENVYHKGQAKIWDGRELLAELVEKHGGVHIAPEKLAPLRRLFAIIFWGELAAWKVAAELALTIEPLEAKLAATAQAHDEARHFYVMHDYLQLIGYQPGELPHHAAYILETILNADSLVHKLLGMQLMVEPIALTLFQLVRANELEPVLCELLKYYERDEARHISLGVNFLPAMLAELSPLEQLDVWRFQLKMINAEIDGAKVLEPDFRALGFSPREVLRLGTGKQLTAVQMLVDQAGIGLPATEMFCRFAEARMEWDFPADDAGAMERLRRVISTLAKGADERKYTPLRSLYA